MPRTVYDNFYHHNRNYGCRFNEIVYKGYTTVVIENEKLRLSVLLDKGTDIVELLYKPKDIDFMWRSPLEWDAGNKNPLSKDLEIGNFLDVYEGGWQELLPSITAPTNYKGMGLGFHGEAIYLPWKYEVVEDSPYSVKIRFFVRMRRSPLFVTKCVTLTSESSVVEFEETVANEGDEEFKFMWGHHPAIGKPFLDENCVIDLPPGSRGRSTRLISPGTAPSRRTRSSNGPSSKTRRGSAST